MNHNDLAAYRVFAAYVADHPECDNLEAMRHTMRETGGRISPDLVTEWWHMWQIMRKVMREAGG